ncbi:MAG TPA: hypothetical protein VGD80_24240, partial [Kofleriaceae bacterium]
RPAPSGDPPEPRHETISSAVVSSTPGSLLVGAPDRARQRGGMPLCRQALQGKDYVIRDGDVVNFKLAV